MSWDSLIEEVKNVADLKDRYLLSGQEVLVLHMIVSAKDWCVSEDIDLREISFHDIAKLTKAIPEPDTKTAREYLSLCERRQEFMRRYEEGLEKMSKTSYKKNLRIVEDMIRKKKNLVNAEARA